MVIAKPTDAFISTATGEYPGVLVARQDVLKHFCFNPAGIDRISHRTVPTPMQIEPPSASWPADFAALEARIRVHLPASELLYMQHVGSTSIPGMPAKPVIDIDIVVRDVTDEAAYRPGLEAAGLHFLCREPHGGAIACATPPRRTQMCTCLDPSRRSRCDTEFSGITW